MTFRLSGLLVVLLSAACLAYGADAPRPNIVFIIADDMGYADVGFNGGKDIKTPAIDSIAAAGARFDAFYVQPICSPTRAALMTGRYPSRYGFQVGVVRPWATYGLPLEERMLPVALKEAGYETAITGKWHLGHLTPDYLPTHRGFDHQYGHYNGAIDYFTHDRDGGFDWHKDDVVNHDEGYSTTLVANEAARLIKEHKGDKPLFLYVPFNAVHSPHQVPDKYKEPYKSLPEPRQTYAGMMAAMDEGIGTILAAIDQKKIRDNTLIVFTSDNGGPQPGKVTDNGVLRAGKGSVYEGGTRVAACAAWQGKIPAGSTVKQPFHIVDFYPTLIGLAGGKLEQKLPIDGKDAWATISANGPSPHADDAILINTTPVNGAIRVGDWKLVINGKVQDNEGPETSAKGAGVEAEAQKPKQTKAEKRAERAEDGTEQLFNLADDVSEKTDVAAKHPEKVKELRAKYDKYATEAIPPKAKPKAADFKSPKVWGQAD
jgi:arylsulfatase A-like enzyme